MNQDQKLNPREELVFLLRGFFSTPILTQLGKIGFIDIVCAFERPFSASDISKELNLANIVNLNYILKYLSSIGLIEVVGDDPSLYSVTIYGQKIMTRWGSSALLYSYRDAMNNIEELLKNDHAVFPACDRLDNVIGSGLTNGRKFFPASLRFLESKEHTLIADLCCGDGKFLSLCSCKLDNVTLFASDLSEISVSSAEARFLSEGRPKLDCIVSDVLDVGKWSEPIKRLAMQNHISEHNLVLCFWYLIHEISGHDPENVINLLQTINRVFPSAKILIGEIINLPPDLLSKNKYSSIMPEFTLFHDLSGQGLLSWEQYTYILSKIPFEIQEEELFDKISLDDGSTTPSAFVWLLSPSQN